MNTTPAYDVLVAAGAGVDTVVRVDALQLPPGDSVFVPPARSFFGPSPAIDCGSAEVSTGFIGLPGLRAACARAAAGQ